MLTAIPVRWLEDNRGWLVETKLTASGSAAAAAALSGALAGEQHSRESLQWACAPNTPEALNQSGRRKQAQAHPLPPGRQLGGAVHLKASDRYSSGGGKADDTSRARLDAEVVGPAGLTRMEQPDVGSRFRVNGFEVGGLVPLSGA